MTKHLKIVAHARGTRVVFGSLMTLTALVMLYITSCRTTIKSSQIKDVIVDLPEYSSVKLTMTANEKTGDVIATFNIQGTPFKTGDQVSLAWDVLRSRFDINCSSLRRREMITIPATRDEVKLTFKVDPKLLADTIDPNTTQGTDDNSTKYDHLIGGENYVGNAVVEGCLMIPGVGIAAKGRGLGEPNPPGSAGFALNDEEDPNAPAHIRYAERCSKAIGYVKPFSCLESGQVVPITKDGVVQNSIPDKCDRAVYLEGPDRCGPFTRVGQLTLYTDKTYTTPKTNISAVFFCRHYNDASTVNVTGEENSSGANYPYFKDVAIIAQDHATGKSCYFQALGPGGESLYGRRVPPPSETDEEWAQNTTEEEKAKGAQPASSFWLRPSAIAQIHCITCHDNDPFMHSPWIDQVKVLNSSGQPTARLLVPSQPFLPYKVIGKDFGFERWDTSYHFNLPENACTSCHRMSVMKTCRSWVKDAFPLHEEGQAVVGQYYTPGRLSDKGKSHPYHHWMPPPPRNPAAMPDWEASLSEYEDSVKQLRNCCDLQMNGRRVLGFGRINQPSNKTLSQEELDFLSQNGCPVEAHSEVVER
jgi:hypothetical protein